MPRAPVLDGNEVPGPEPAAGCFPITLFGWCPLPVKMFIPDTLNTIQDTTHACLMVGISAGIVTSLKEISFWGHEGVMFRADHFDNFTLDCVRGICLVIAVVPNLLYFSKIIGRFNQSIMIREKAIAETKQALIKDYEGYVQGMDEMLGRATQSSATLAEFGFEGKRRDFIRFLERVEMQAGRMVHAGDVDMDGLRHQFIEFVTNWLKVFAECSVDPINRPKFVISEAELESCRNVPEVANLVKERLQYIEVQFISQQTEKDRETIHGFRQQQERMAGAAPAPTGGDIEMTSQVPGGGVLAIPAQQPLMPAGPGGSGYVAPAPEMQQDESAPCNWLSITAVGCYQQRSTQYEGWPWTIQCVCLRMSLMSTDHILLIVGFVLGCFAWVLDFVLLVFLSHDTTKITMEEDKTKEPDADNNYPKHEVHTPVPGDKYEHQEGILLVSLFLFEGVVLMVLRHFDKLDMIQKLEAECGRLREQREAAEERHKIMVDFWGEVQLTTDIWAHRTAPRLDLYKEVQECIQDTAKGGNMKELHTALCGINNRLEVLEDRLPALAYWRKDAAITEQSKKTFSAGLKAIYANSSSDPRNNLPRILTGVSALCQDGIPAIADAQAASGGYAFQQSGHVDNWSSASGPATAYRPR